MKEPVAGPDGGEKGVAGEKGPKGRNNWRTESSARLQSANLGKGQWFAAGFIGKFLKRENTYPARVAKDSLAKSSGGGFFGCGRLRGHVYSKTRMRPSSSGTTGAFRLMIDDCGFEEARRADDVLHKGSAASTQAACQTGRTLDARIRRVVRSWPVRSHSFGMRSRR